MQPVRSVLVVDDVMRKFCTADRQSLSVYFFILAVASAEVSAKAG